jgi:gamma-glutamyltranspeptidase/glutathione hydrolase
MVATAFPLASEAGVEVLRAGGNAVDAAVAAAFALAVCEPSGSGLGGQTTLLIYFGNGKSIVVDGHSYAPAGVSLERVSAGGQEKGYCACAIPSTVATLGHVQSKYGVLSLARVLEPAICLAQNGYPITALQRRQMGWCLADLLESPSAAHLFLKNGRPFDIGDMFVQKELAGTLARLARFGTEEFYQGQIASEIARDMRDHGGLITARELADCKLPIEREPLCVEYRGRQVLSVPPPGGGLQILLGLKVLERFSSSELLRQTDTWYDALAQTTDVVIREKDRLPVHPREFTPSLRDWLLSSERVDKIFRTMDANCAEAQGGMSPEEPGETTHLCTADQQGNVVALTQSIQSLFGARVVTDDLGFLYNNYLTNCPRYPHPYMLAGGCLPRSNASPTLVLGDVLSESHGSGKIAARGPKPVLALGGAGSRRIISGILQVISNVLDRQMPLDVAVSCPRIHPLRGRKVKIELPAVTDSLLHLLQKHFSEVNIKAPNSFSMGSVQAIGFQKDGTLVGAADPRRDGTAAGLKRRATT